MKDDIIEPKIRRRTEMGTIVDILMFLRRTPSRKTQVIMATGTSHKVLSKYIDKLVKGGYIIMHQLSNKTGYFYTMSVQGGEILKQFQDNLALVREIMDVEN